MSFSIPAKSIRNSELYNLVKTGVLKPGEQKFATLPSGNNVAVKYVKNDGVAKAAEYTKKYGVEFEPEPENYIQKSIYNEKGHLIESKHDVVNGGTRLSSIVEHTPNGKIEHVFTEDGRKGGRAWSNDKDIAWGYTGNIMHPDSASSCIHRPPYKNDESKDAFKAATEYVRGTGSLDAYNKEMAK